LPHGNSLSRLDTVGYQRIRGEVKSKPIGSIFALDRSLFSSAPIKVLGHQI